jgi:RNA polymerase sigma-B factor
MAPLSSPRRPAESPTAQFDAAHAHEQAEHLLASVEGCTDPSRRKRLQQEAVLLTLDLPEAIAHRYQGRGIDFEDLLQVGRMALVKAVRGYRPGRGASFAAYAVPTIAGEIKRYFRDCGWAVRPPRRLQEVRVELGAQEAQLQQELRREPTLDELAESMGLVREDIREVKVGCAAYSALSLDAPAPGLSGPAEMPDRGPDEYEAIETRDALRQALSGLTDRERQIVRRRFIDEWTQSQIGDELGVSQMQVSRLLSGILQQLREGLRDAPVEREPASAAS